MRTTPFCTRIPVFQSRVFIFFCVLKILKAALSDHISVNLSVGLYVYVCRNWSDNWTYSFLSNGSCITAQSNYSNWIYIFLDPIPSSIHTVSLVPKKKQHSREKGTKQQQIYAATTEYADPRSAMTTPKLRQDLESRTGQSETWWILLSCVHIHAFLFIRTLFIRHYL